MIKCILTVETKYVYEYGISFDVWMYITFLRKKNTQFDRERIEKYTLLICFHATEKIALNIK